MNTSVPMTMPHGGCILTRRVVLRLLRGGGQVGSGAVRCLTRRGDAIGVGVGGRSTIEPHTPVGRGVGT